MQGLVQSIVVLPDPIKTAIVALIAFGFSYLLSQLALALPWLAEFLGPYKDEAVVVVSGALIVFIESQLNLFPAYEPLINAGLAFVVALLAFFGLPFVTFKFFQRRGFRAFRGYRSIF